MPHISSYSLTATATKLSPPAGLGDADSVVGTFVTPASPVIGLGESGTAFADALQLPVSTPTEISADDPPYAILDTAQTHTLVVLWSGRGV